MSDEREADPRSDAATGPSWNAPPAAQAPAGSEGPPASERSGPREAAGGAPEAPSPPLPSQPDRAATARSHRGAAWWIGWLLALPAAGLLLTGPVAVLTRPNPDPYVVGLVFGRLAGPLLVGFAVRGLYKAASRARPRPRLLSPWVLVVAGLVFLLLAFGRIGDELATRARAEQLRSIPPARYLTLSAPYESVRLPASEETAVRDQVARTLADAQASEFEVRIVRRGGEQVAVAFAFRVQPTTAAQEDFWPGVVTGLEQGAGRENVDPATLEGRPAAIARMTDQTLVIWQEGTVVAGVAAPDRETAEAVARAVISANAEPGR